MERENDLKEIKLFTEIFEKRFKKRLGLTPYVIRNKFRDYIGYGAESIFINPVPEDFIDTKWRRDARAGMLWLETDINPNGVTGKDDIARTYTIKFEQVCQGRRKYARNWHTEMIYHFYGYGRSIEEAMEKFEEYLNKTI